jgi:hypothetical protein
MPAWITLSAASLADYLVAEQLDALRTEALGSGQADPFLSVSADVIRLVRSYIASNPENLVDSTDLTIPPELKLPVCYLIIAPMLGRLGLALTEDQRKQVDLAQSTLIALREKKLLVTKPDNAVAPAVQHGGGIELASSTRRQATRASLAGL